MSDISFKLGGYEFGPYLTEIRKLETHNKLSYEENIPDLIDPGYLELTMKGDRESFCLFVLEPSNELFLSGEEQDFKLLFLDENTEFSGRCYLTDLRHIMGEGILEISLKLTAKIELNKIELEDGN